jgi:hypothetical protein
LSSIISTDLTLSTAVRCRWPRAIGALPHRCSTPAEHVENVLGKTNPSPILRRIFKSAKHPGGELTDLMPRYDRRAFLFGLLASHRGDSLDSASGESTSIDVLISQAEAANDDFEPSAAPLAQAEDLCQ